MTPIEYFWAALLQCRRNSIAESKLRILSPSTETVISSPDKSTILHIDRASKTCVNITDLELRRLMYQFDLEATNSQKSVERRQSKDNPTPPDGGFGWVVVMASLLCSLLTDGVIYSFGVLTPEFYDHYNVSRTFVGMMGSVLVGITLAVGPLANVMCNRWGYRVVTVIGSLMAAIGFGAPFLFDNLWLLVTMASVVTGAGFGLIYFPSLVIVNLYFEKKKGIALGIAVCGSGIGTFVMSPLIEYLIDEYGWRGAMFIVSALLLNCVPCGLLYRPIIDTVDEAKQHQVSDNDSDSKPKSMTTTVLTDPIFILFAVANFLTNVGFNAPFLYAKDRALSVGISSSNSSYLISSIGVGNCVGRVFFGFLATIKGVSTFHLYNASLIISGLSIIVSWGAVSYVWMIVYTFVFGLMTGTYVTLTTMLLSNLFGKEKLSASFALLNIVQGAAVFIGPPLAGAVYDATNSFDLAFTVCGVFMAMSGIVMYTAYLSTRFRRNQCQK